MLSNEATAADSGIRQLVDAFIAAYEIRDADALKAFIAPWALDVKGGIRGFIDESLHRNNEMSSMGFVVPSADGTRALAHIAVGKPGKPVRGVRLLFQLAVDGRWLIINAANDGGVEAAFLLGLHDGVSQFNALPLSSVLIRKGQRIVQALTEGGDVAKLMEVAGDKGQGAAMALAMLRGQVKPTQRFTVLPCREHPVASRGAIGFGLLDLQSKFASEFWIVCHIDGDEFEILGTSSFMAIAMLMGHFGKDKPRPRVHPMAAASDVMPVSGDAFDQAIHRALQDVVANAQTSDGMGDAFDRAVRGHMEQDEAARDRFASLFEALAGDRRDELVRKMLKPGNPDAAGDASQLQALWSNNDFLGVVRTAVATYLAPFAEGGKPIDIDRSFMAQHGEALVGTVFAAIFQPMAEGMNPESLFASKK